MRTWGDGLKHPAVIAVLAAMLGLLANTIVTVLGQSYATRVEDQRDRREVVLELMRSGNRETTIEKLRILHGAGLLPDPSGRLEAAVRGSRAFADPCVDPRLIPTEPELVGPLVEDARQSADRLGAATLEMRAYARTLRALLAGCLVEPESTS